MITDITGAHRGEMERLAVSGNKCRASSPCLRKPREAKGPLPTCSAAEEAVGTCSSGLVTTETSCQSVDTALPEDGSS